MPKEEETERERDKEKERQRLHTFGTLASLCQGRVRGEQKGGMRGDKGVVIFRKRMY